MKKRRGREGKGKEGGREEKGEERGRVGRGGASILKRKKGNL